MAILNEYNLENSLFTNDYKLQEFKRILLTEKEKGNLVGFGNAKIEEAVFEFKKYINFIG
ncbi:hypothetical protein EI546_03650 [Aequorivita sp. H23M31]|uniref:Uncharacterized protein n=1 Tax=Aequorivita ciconiae TaxID=2494375 RepID=A0A410G0S8_9FLAO|nr:hypothetical protein [Aequorivita sp. H23M31]QAA80878.1 hypothetical protein EI546_03650 [Aequorivita sp. H23M31]